MLPAGCLFAEKSFFNDKAQRIEDPGVGAVLAEVTLQDIEQIIIKTAEGPHDDDEQEGGFEVRRLEEQSAGPEQSGGEEEPALEVNEARGFKIVGEFHMNAALSVV